MRALEVENNLILKAVQLTKSGLRVFGFCPAGSTSKMEFNQVLRHDSGLTLSTGQVSM